MGTRFRLSDLIPAEFNVEAVHDAADAIVVVASGRSEQCRCPTVEPSPGAFIVAILGCLPICRVRAADRAEEKRPELHVPAAGLANM